MDQRLSDRLSDRLSSHPDAAAAAASSFSSFPRQRWPQPTPSSSSFSPAAHLEVNPCRNEPALSESMRAYRTTALRQLKGSPTSNLSWKACQAANTSASSRPSSSSLSQPVLVRSYSGSPDDSINTPTKMPSRRSFLFTSNSNYAQRREPQLPSDEEFGIDGILRAIEPNIRGTLDSIGEICGRSKLSLANEYGSHIAPLGEISAPPGGLLPVEEASSDHEGYSGENVVIYDDENTAADGRDHNPFSHYTFFDTLLPPISPPSHGRQPARDGSSAQAPHDQPTLGPPLATREFASKPKAGGRALLANPTESGSDDRVQNILTPALVSEILLDAQANGHSLNSDSPPGARPDQLPESLANDVQSLFRWLKQASRSNNAGTEQQTAEMRLRAMLERQNEITQ